MHVTVIDTCCLINLYASQRFEELVRTSLRRALVPEMVFDEALYVLRPSDDDPEELVREEMDLTNVCTRGVLEACRFENDAEVSRFVELATLIDDGEAACLTISSLRGHDLATDDRRAQGLAADLDVPVISTPQLLQRWRRNEDVPSDALAHVIHRIERYAKYWPHHTSPHYEWWQQHRGA